MYDEDMVDAVGIVATVAVLLIAFGVIASLTDSPENDFATMCQNSDYIRVDDSECDRGVSGTSIMYISTGSSYNAPGIGSKIDQGQVIRNLPSGKTSQKGGISATGGTVKSSPGITRGGFGSTSGSKGSSSS